jgi:hypothetical protein
MVSTLSKRVAPALHPKSARKDDPTRGDNFVRGVYIYNVLGFCNFWLMRMNNLQSKDLKNGEILDIEFNGQSEIIMINGNIVERQASMEENNQYVFGFLDRNTGNNAYRLYHLDKHSVVEFLKNRK